MALRRRPPSRRGIVIGIIVLILFAALASARFYTDVLWFREVGLSSVLFKSIWVRALVGVAAGIVTAAVVWLNLWIAGRLKPAYRPTPLEFASRPDPMDQYRDAMRPYIGWIRLAIAGAVGLLAGLAASASWQTILLWLNKVPFGTDDPQFGRDVGFYVFELPAYRFLADWLWLALIASLLLSIGAHYFHGSIRPEARLAGVSPGALGHISVLLGLLSLVKTAQYWIGQFDLNFSSRGVIDGAGYTDVHAQLPALRLLMIISVVSALLFLVNIRFRRLSLPLAAVGIWILTAVLAGGVWPWWVQRFSVEPQELQREREYIGRNIAATREAFNLEEVESRFFPASTDLTAEDLEANQQLLANVRVWDPPLLGEAFLQLQGIRPYYAFPDVDVDRYEIDGQMRQVLLSARELSLTDLPEPSRTWQNLHMQYTHGYGLVASLANESTAGGQPEFLVQDVPNVVEAGAETLEPAQPRIYYGEAFESDEYSIVPSEQGELDFSTDEGAQRSNYEGAGGIELGNWISRIAFAIRESDTNLVLSGLINNDSKILIYRNLRDRVRRAAPFLALDHDPYIAAVDDRLVWIVDAYTSTRWYPYSQRFNATDIISSDAAGRLSGEFNYMRNSVKIVVDAYDGTMTFYVVDDGDPLIAAWQKTFPDLFTEEVPSPELREHLRYPEDLFKIQSEVYLDYHIDSADDFYSKEDAWAVPESSQSGPNGTEAAGPIDPTYLLLDLPGESGQEFLLTRPFTPRGRRNMIAFMVARSDPEAYGELLTFQFPRSIAVSGPEQVDSLINQDVEISQTITLLGQEGSNVSFGSLVTLPIEDSILYVRPLFVTGTTVRIPELKRVILVLGEEVAVGEDFQGALEDLFGLEPGAEPTPAPEPTEPEQPEEPGEEPEAPDLAALIERAGRVYEQAQQALSDGDFERYGRLIEQLGSILARAEGLSEQ